jgi:hypothetical protein
MICNKFISIRLEPGKETRVYVDSMKKAKRSVNGLRRFQLESPLEQQGAKGAAIKIDAMRWPEGQVYGAPISMALSSQWPFGTKLYETNDTAGHTTGRSLGGVEFEYDEAAMTLSWSQDYKGTGAKVSGSIGFNEVSPVWYVTLELDPAATATKGELVIDKEVSIAS